MGKVDDKNSRPQLVLKKKDIKLVVKKQRDDDRAGKKRSTKLEQGKEGG